MVYCSNQKEHEFIHACKQHLEKEALRDAFVFTCDRMRRYEGAWHLECQPLFPGYVFLESENEKQLAEELKKYPGISKVIQDGRQLIPVEEVEKAFLKNLCEAGHHSGMSRGYIQDGRTYVTEGPLKGKEYLIRKIDRHKRTAQVELPAGTGGRIQVGLEIVAKG